MDASFWDNLSLQCPGSGCSSSQARPAAQLGCSLIEYPKPQSMLMSPVDTEEQQAGFIHNKNGNNNKKQIIITQPPPQEDFNCRVSSGNSFTPNLPMAPHSPFNKDVLQTLHELLPHML
jgi:hypothetical protein